MANGDASVPRLVVTEPADQADPVGPAGSGFPAYTVTGMVTSPALPGVAGVTVQLVDKNVGGDQLLGTTQTGGDGSYSFSALGIDPKYLAAHYKTQPDLQVQVLMGDQFLAASQVSYAAPATISLDVVLPAGSAGLPSEYETLTASLAVAYPGSLGALQEGNGRGDITYLGNSTGIDLRIVALLALAAQFGQIIVPLDPPAADQAQTLVLPAPTASLQPEFYYALFRAGLPASADSLFGVDSGTVQAIWQQATAQGVIPQALAADVPAAVQNFQALSAAHTLTAVPPAGVSTLQEMLQPTLPNLAQQRQFAQLHAQYQDDWASFWTAAEQAFGTAATAQLQMTGQFYTLTVSNEPLVSNLLAAEASPPLTSAQDLAARGYYAPGKWAPLIGSSIPAGIPGADADEQASNYAQLLAAQIRIAFPTAVMADQVAQGILPIAGTAQTVTGVASFLTANQGQFEIGVEPVASYIARTGVTGTPAEVITQIQRLQRAYQLTPDDTSLAVLLQHNLDSAFAVTRYDAASFARAFASQLGGADSAAAIHTRARQIFATTLSVTVAYLTGRVAPGLGGQTPVQFGYPPPSVAASSPVVASPTLEDLFGSLDYCNCTDCGSILSPAAYLVDLLNYLDQLAPTPGFRNPQDVLLGRRPDLQYLPLTCANTNTAMPYIDIVNETLEYFVANGLQLDNYQGHDTPDAVTSADLLASPQYVDDAAYAILQDAFFPPPLPFSRPLALLRLHLQNLGLALPDTMAALRSGDQLDDRTTPTSYGWSDILIEQLTVSRDEYRLFTDPALLLGDLYGLPEATALADLQQMSLQDLSRRLGVSYADLSAIVQTRFINPNAALIPRLQQLNAPFATLRDLHDNLNTPQSIAASFISALPAGLDATQYGGTSPGDYQAVVAWVTGSAVYPLIMDIITISDSGANTGDCSGAGFQLRYSSPDNTSNLLSGTDYLKLIRFIRLWRKLAPLLGDASDVTAIRHTDDVIAALYPAADVPADTSDPANDPANRPLLDAGFARLLLRLGVLLRVLSQLSLSGQSVDQLLACWAPIGTAGPGSLYQAMFLTPGLLQQDPGAQTATVAATINVGDVLQTAINLPGDQPGQLAYTVQSGDTAATAAAAIAAALNASTAPDPASGLPLSARFHATSSGGVVTIRAGFSLTCAVSAGASETYTAAAASPVSQDATVAGSVTAGDTLTTTIDGVAVDYAVAATDTPATIAAGLATMINNTTAPDPYSGLPLNSVVVAASAAAVVTIVTANAGAPFALACSFTPANAGTYSAGPPVPAAQTAAATVSGTIPAGAMLTTTLNGLPLAYLAAPGDTPATIAVAIAAIISATTTADPLTGLPLNAVVTASAAGGVITLTAVSPTTPVTLTALLTAGGYTAGQQTPPFADNGYGDFLTDAGQTLFGHEPTLCAAFNLTGAEFALITAALGFDPSTPLTLANVSEVFRYGWLARTLGLSAGEFLLLREFTGLDPFAPLDPGSAAPAEPPAVRFISLLAALAAAGLTTAQALYLMWNQDISGTSAPAPADVTGLAFALRADFAAVEAQFILQDDPDGSIAQNLMSLVYGSTASAFLFGLLNRTFTTSVPYAAPPGQTALPQPVIAASNGQLGYNDLSKQLSFSGVLDPAAQSAIDAVITSNPGLSAAVASLEAASQQAVAPFFASYPELAPLYAAYVAATDPVQVKRQALLDNFLPILKVQRKQEQALASVTAAAGTDSSFATALLTDPAIMHADADVAQPAVADLTAIEAQGLSAAFYLGNDLAAPPDQVIDAVAVLSYPQAVGNQLPPGQAGGPIAGAWSGYLTVPQDGLYDIRVAADPGAAIALEIAGAPVPMQQAGTLWESQSPISLQAGALAGLTVTATSIRTTLAVSWQSLGLGWEIIPAGYLYPASLVGRLGDSYVRFLKAANLAAALSLTAAEIAYLGTASPLPVGWLNSLAVRGHPDPGTAAGLADVLGALLDYARLKQALSPSDERLLAVLRNPAATLPSGQTALLSLTGWAQNSVNALLTQFFGSTDPASLSPVENFRRVFDAYRIVQGSRLTAAALISAITNAPSATTVSALQSALRARYAESDWLTVVRPVNDAVRIQQRDALVAYILLVAPAELAFDSADSLFGYFLIDTQTQPAVETSRIRLALSAVQLFIERVIRNLESEACPSDVSTTQWEWMKRYRVWQANREVFLWPENWLYPELRDDQSPSFQQMMSSLLQGDITDDAAASAYLDYLSSLEEVAKLEPCGLYYQPGTADADETSYVVARTAGANRAYYFRQLASGSWTPWTQVAIDCEDMPLTPIVWNGRLFLFWLKVLKQAQPSQAQLASTDSGGQSNTLADMPVSDLASFTSAAASNASTGSVSVQAVLCWTEFYNGKWQPTKTSDVNNPTTIGHFDLAGPGAFENYRSLIQIAPAELMSPLVMKGLYNAQFALPDDALILDISVPGQSPDGGFVLHNTHSLPVRFEDITVAAFVLTISFEGSPVEVSVPVPLSAVLGAPGPARLFPQAQPYTGGYGSGTFGISYLPARGQPAMYASAILQYTWLPRYLQPQPWLPDGWDAPFLYEDRRHLFYVTTTESLVPVGRVPGFGILSASPGALAAGPAISPLVLSQPVVAATPQEVLALSAAVGDPAAVQRFIAAGTNIRTAVALPLTVSYQGQLISPIGSMPSSSAPSDGQGG